jgi:hypothetical protein
VTTIKLCAVFFIALYLSLHSSPALAFAFIIVCLVLHTLGRLVAFVARPFLIGLLGGLGLRESGVLKLFRRRAPRQPWKYRDRFGDGRDD